MTWTEPPSGEARALQLDGELARAPRGWPTAAVVTTSVGIPVGVLTFASGIGLWAVDSVSQAIGSSIACAIASCPSPPASTSTPPSAGPVVLMAVGGGLVAAAAISALAGIAISDRRREHIKALLDERSMQPASARESARAEPIRPPASPDGPPQAHDEALAPSRASL